MSVIEGAGLDARRAVSHDISPSTELLSAEQVVHSIHRAERVLLDELALNQGIGAMSESWAQVTHTVRSTLPQRLRISTVISR